MSISEILHRCGKCSLASITYIFDAWLPVIKFSWRTSKHIGKWAFLLIVFGVALQWLGLDSAIKIPPPLWQWATTLNIPLNPVSKKLNLIAFAGCAAMAACGAWMYMLIVVLPIRVCRTVAITSIYLAQAGSYSVETFFQCVIFTVTMMTALLDLCLSLAVRFADALTSFAGAACTLAFEIVWLFVNLVFQASIQVTRDSVQLVANILALIVQMMTECILLWYVHLTAAFLDITNGMWATAHALRGINLWHLLV